MNQDKIFIVNDEMWHIMRRDPLYADCKNELEKEGFDIVCLDDIQHIKLFSADKECNIGNYQGMAVRSDLFLVDKYFYPMLDYAESYFGHLNLVMEDIAECMGAIEWEFRYLEERYESNKQSSRFGANVNVNIANKGGGGAEYGQTDTNGNVDESKYSEITKVKFNANGKKSPQELKAYIDEQNIDIDIFESQFKNRIQKYIKGENVLYLERDIDNTKHIRQYIDICHTLSANAKVCRVFDAKLKLDLKSALNTERKYRTKLHYKMTFK